MKVEGQYQPEVIARLYAEFAGCVVTKMVVPQGTPDLEILYGKTWAKLEVKKSNREPFQPNQEFYLDMFHKMSFAAMICPQNEDIVFEALRKHFMQYA